MSKTFLIFSAHYLPHIGGVEKYTEQLSCELIKKGNQVIIVTSNIYHLPEIETLQNNLEIVRLPCYKLLNGRFPITRHNKAYKRLNRYLASIQTDYILINTRFYRHTLDAIRLAEEKNIQPIIIDHGSAHLTLGNSLIDPIVSAAEHIITSLVKRHSCDYYAVSDASLHWLEHFGIIALGVLANSIDARAFVEQSSNRSFRSELKIDASGFVVAFTGRLIPEKGITSLLLTAEALSQHPTFHFLIAGDGPLSTYILQRQIPNVTLLGRLETPDIAALLRESNVFCLPSRSEGFSTSLLEAASCGTTPVITNVGGVQELIPDERFGVVLPSVEPSIIATELLKLEQARSRCKTMGYNIAQRVRGDLSWSKVADDTEAACQKAQQHRI